MRAGGTGSLLESKIKDPGRLERLLSSLRSKGKRIVFTNGCFDILHYGHVKYLEKARKQGDVLVVAVNSDDSVRRLKGPSRPVNGQRYRQAVLAALQSVDYVTVFTEDTPKSLIARLKPDVLVKGGDWKKSDIVGSDIVEKRGGKVLSIGFEKGFSTTRIIKNCRGILA
ncbi:MAG: D-glycero-beta-D-manno-heptose 1-phosphate adenylyltransferase [Deltaproteobacteria bacterium]